MIKTIGKLVTLVAGLAVALTLALMFAPPAQAQDTTSDLLLPLDGADLCVGDVISWNTDAGEDGTYRLRIGTEANGNDILNRTYPTVAAAGQAIMTEMVPMLPDDADIYVSLRYQTTTATTWVFQDDAVYASCDSPITIQSDFADLCVGDVLSWEEVAPDGKYRLHIGTAEGESDLLNQKTTDTELPIQLGLPETGSLYVSLRYKPAVAGASWTTIDQRSFLACVGPIDITGPIGELCTGDSIQWPALGKAQIRLGTATDTRDIWVGTTWDASIEAPILPAGIPIFASLRGQNAEGRWVLYDIVEYAPCSNPIDLSSPAPGTALCSSDELLWTGDADRFRIWVGSTFGGNDLFNQTSAESGIVMELLPQAGDRYVTLLAKQDGTWTTHSESTFAECDFEIDLFSVDGFSDVCPGDTLSTTGPTTGSSRVWIGTSVGDNDLLSYSIPAGADFVVPEANVSGDSAGIHVSVLHKPIGKEWAIHYQDTWSACKATPTARDDGPAPGSIAGDNYHLELGEVRDVEVGDSENLLDNDNLGQPYAEITTFNGVAVDPSTGATVTIAGGGTITVFADGSFSVIAPAVAEGTIFFPYVIANSEGSSTADVTLKWSEPAPV